MRKPLLSLVVVLFAACLAAAQTAPPDMVCEVHVNKVKPGMITQYEQGRAKHMAWHKSQNDSWSWDTWEITTGPDTGGYLISTCGHAWKDFDGRDKFNTADGANANATMGTSIGSDTVAYYVLRPDVSATPKPTTPPYLSVIFFHLKPEGFTDFTSSLKQINAAFEKTSTPRSTAYWYSLANGGSGPEMVLVQERDSMAEMAGKTSKTLDEMVKEAYGDDTVLMTLRKAYYHSDSELLHYRADLSYMAASTK